MAPYLAAVRNYWALLPAIAVIVVLILLYAIPTLINPQWTSSIMALFRQSPYDAGTPDSAQPPAGQPVTRQPATGQPTGAERAAEAERAAGLLTPQQAKSRRMLAAALVVGAVALIGFNISLNREANACYQAATAWGAVPGKADEDPCVNKIYGTFIGDGKGSAFEKNPQPATAYQLVKDKKPKYLRWIQNAPKYDETDLVIGSGGTACPFDLRVEEKEDKILVFYDADVPCPPEDDISLTPIKLKEPLGDRKVVTLDDKPMQQINPDVDSWPTVLKKLVTGG